MEQVIDLEQVIGNNAIREGGITRSFKVPHLIGDPPRFGTGVDKLMTRSFMSGAPRNLARTKFLT